MGQVCKQCKQETYSLDGICASCQQARYESKIKTVQQYRNQPHIAGIDVGQGESIGTATIQMDINRYEAGGLTPEEREIMDLVMLALMKYRQLPNVRADHNYRVTNAINNIKYVLGQRVLYRLFPQYWKGE